ncbi:MAG: ATP-binding protein [Bacteroidota bacterium]
MVKKLHIESKIANIRTIENEIDNIIEENGINQENYGKILIATLEAVNNAIIHGNRSDASKYVDVEIVMNNDTIIITVRDEGNGFRPKEVPDPTQPENLEEINGRGVFLMRKLADRIEFNKKGNSVKMTFNNIRN